MTAEQLVTYIILPLIGSGGAIAAIWQFYSRIWFPNQQERQKAQQAEAERQREHEREAAKRSAEEQARQREHERQMAELAAKSQTEQKKDEQEHLQKSQGDALQALLGITTELIKNLIEQSNGRATRQTEALTQMSSSMIKMESIVGVTGRDWSKMNEILSDIDIELHEIKTAVKLEERNRNEPG